MERRVALPLVPDWVPALFHHLLPKVPQARALLPAIDLEVGAALATVLPVMLSRHLRQWVRATASPAQAERVSASAPPAMPVQSSLLQRVQAATMTVLEWLYRRSPAPTWAYR